MREEKMVGKRKKREKIKERVKKIKKYYINLNFIFDKDNRFMCYWSIFNIFIYY